MRDVTLICRDCGHKDTIQVLTPEEERNPRFPRIPVTCPKCRSRNVEIHTS
jgi:hypothetical protein